MKKIVLSLSFFVAMVAAVAQNVPREMVVLEIGTGTWCTYCPGAAMGADDLLEYGCQVAVIENHNGDPFANTYSNARNSMYGVSAYPSAAFDGREGYVGGSHSSSLFGAYLGKYNACIGIPSPVAMSMEVESTDYAYTVTVEMTKVGTISGSNLVLYFFVTQSNITYAWQGQTHLEHVNGLMVPSQTGTPVSFSSGDVQTVELNFELASTTPLEDIEFIALLQDKTTGQGTIPGTAPYTLTKWEALQTIKKAAIDLTPDFSANSTVVDKFTQVSFTNETTGGYIHTPESYEWQFPGANPETSTEKNPTTFYNQCGAHDVTLTVNRGGQIETVVKTTYIQVGPVAEITSSPGDTTCWFQPITLDAADPMAATYLWEPGGATSSSIVLDGAVVGIGEHTYSVTVASAGGCESTVSHTIYFDACTGIDKESGAVSASVYPNPTNGQFLLELNAAGKTTVELQIVNTLGSTVYNETGVQVNGKLLKDFHVELSDGIYFLVIRTGAEKSVQKLFITH